MARTYIPKQKWERKEDLNIYSGEKKYDEALELLLKAHKLAPKDLVVIANIAATYKDLNNKKKAIKYFKLMKKHGTLMAKEFASNQIEELK